jgi:hypothetical protein
MNSTQKAFYEKSLLERGYLKLIFDKLPTAYDYKTWMTPAEGYEVYDGVILRFEKGTSKLIDRMIVEVKVRDKFYPELILEKIKLDDLKKVRRQMDTKTKKECYTDVKTRLIYINITPQGSFFFDLDKLNKTFNWVEEMHWVSTTDKSKGKILKSLTKIDSSKGKPYNIKTGDYINVKAVEVMSVNHSRTRQLGIIF